MSNCNGFGILEITPQGNIRTVDIQVADIIFVLDFMDNLKKGSFVLEAWQYSSL